MQLHIPTMLVVSVFVFTLMGLLAVHAWLRETRERPLAYLGCMMLLAALGMVLVSLRGYGLDAVAVVLGNVVLLLSAAMNWTAMRVFTGRSPSTPGILAGASLWLGLCLVPVFYQTLPLRVATYSILAACYGLLTIMEFVRGRKTLEVAYWPALILTVLHTFFYGVRSMTDLGLPLDQALRGVGSGVGFFSFMLFESMLYVIGIGYVTLAMVKERAELRFKAAALCDALTGAGNRRAFRQHGEQLLKDCAQRNQPAALLLCDLDHFKRLNDTFGHHLGDQALIAFAHITQACLRKQDVFARIGGEEFACVLQDTDLPHAVLVAERIRQGFAELTLLEPGSLSVSIGVVTSIEVGYDLVRLLSQADAALYVAKGKGRNRVQVAGLEAVDPLLA